MNREFYARTQTLKSCFFFLSSLASRDMRIAGRIKNVQKKNIFHFLNENCYRCILI